MKTTIILLITILLSALSLTVNAACRIRMIDSLNKIDTILQLRKISIPSTTTGIYKITDRFGEESEYSVIMTIFPNGKYSTIRGVPGDMDMNEITTRYRMENDSQLTFYNVENFRCNETEKALINFFISEWFYFG